MLEIRRLEKSCGGIGFFAEHGWGTWDRLRSSPALLFEILVAGTSIVCGIIAALRFWPTDAKVWAV